MLAGAVVFAADDHQPVVTAKRTVRRGVEVGAWWCRPLAGHHEVTHRIEPGEEQAAVGDRVVRGDHDVTGAHPAQRGVHHTAFLDLGDADAFHDPAAGPFQPLGQTQQPVTRVELSLPGEPDRPHRAYSRLDLVDVTRGQPRFLGRVRFPPQVVGPSPAGRVDETVLTAERAVDTELCRGGRDPVERADLGLPVLGGPLGALAGFQGRVDQRVLGGHLRRGVARDAARDLSGFQYEHRSPGAGQLVGRRQPGDPGADHDDLGLRGQQPVPPVGCGGGVDPK